MKSLLPILAACLIVTGCKTHSVVVVASTFLGAQVSENPATQLYEAKFGYGRGEFAVVPGNTNDPTAVADVIMEIRVENIFKGGLIYERVAIGQNAVQQAGAALLFSKDSKGNLGGTGTNSIEGVIQKLQAIKPTK